MVGPTKANDLLPVLVKGFESDDLGIRCQTAWLMDQLLLPEGRVSISFPSVDGTPCRLHLLHNRNSNKHRNWSAGVRRTRDTEI
jgi:hypothetical protein